MLEASGTVLTNKYSEGYAGKRYYEGQQLIDQIETMAIERAKALFGVDHANVQPYSGSPANLAVYLAFLQPGDTVMGMALPMGGHLTHGWKVSATGKWFRSVQYGVRARHRPDRLRRGARPRPGRVAQDHLLRRHGDPAHHRLRAVRRDRARGRRDPRRRHRAHRRPGRGRRAPDAGRPRDVITTTTHKTLRGPRGAMIMSTEEHAKALDRAVFPGLQGGPHNHTTAAIAVALHEAAQPEFRTYAARIVDQRARLAEDLIERGFDVVSGGTDNHLILIDLTTKDVPGKVAAQALDRAGLELNYNAVPFDTRVRSTRPASARYAGGHHPRHGRDRDARDRPLDGRGRRSGQDRRRRRARQDRRRGLCADVRLPDLRVLSQGCSRRLRLMMICGTDDLELSAAGRH